MNRIAARIALATTLLPLSALAQSTPPKTWVDKDTGHRVIRLTDEPGSSGFYFNNNAYTPDLKTMIYNAPDGIRGMDMVTRKTRLIVPNPPTPPAITSPASATASTPSSPVARPTASSTPRPTPPPNKAPSTRPTSTPTRSPSSPPCPPAHPASPPSTRTRPSPPAP